MFRIVALLSLVAVCLAQQHNYNRDPQTAAILSEQRYLSGDGTFGSAYTQEDGVEFKEESDVNGNRKGSYSYVDPSGQRRTVTYTAGKDGFRATGDHLPVAPPAPAAPAPAAYQPQQAYHQPQQAYQAQGRYDDGSYNPSLYEQNYNSVGAAPVAPQQHFPQAQQYAAAPQQQQHFAPQPQQQQYQPQPQQYQQTTPAPHRFFPPGKLNLQRNPDGFSYSFNKA